jgi:hypothetical protein
MVVVERHETDVTNVRRVIAAFTFSDAKPRGASFAPSFPQVLTTNDSLRPVLPRMSARQGSRPFRPRSMAPCSASAGSPSA